MTGSLQTLYKSVDSLKTEYFEPNVNSYTVLKPKHSVTLPLLSVNEAPTLLRYFKCPSHYYGSDRRGATCPHGNCRGMIMSEVNLTYVTPAVFEHAACSSGTPGYVKVDVPYMVMDNLGVKPMSITLIKSHVPGFDLLVKEVVKFGMVEGLALLRASLETTDVLTAVFLGTKRKTRKQSWRIHWLFSPELNVFSEIQP